MIAGLTAIAALSFLVLFGNGASNAGASETVTCTATNPGPSGVLDVSVSGTATAGDSLSIVANGGEFSVWPQHLQRTIIRSLQLERE
jgi:hypothetical protein